MDKLKELTDKLYQEGLSKGRQEGEALLADAKKQAEELVVAARKEADAIIAQAEKDAEDYRIKIESDLKMAARQSIQATRQDIETLIVSKAAEPAAGVLSDEAFVKEVITAVAKNFSKDVPADLSLILPEKLREGLEPFVKNELATILGGKVQAEFSKKIAGGFRIGPADGSYFISMTDETFEELIKAYLRPTARKLLFGE
jgi:V/A-type H+-transporting ATPase subunit E